MKPILITLALLGSLVLVGQEQDSLKIHRDQFRVGFSHDVFNDQLSNWNTISLESKFANAKWQMLPRLSLSQRFDLEGVYLELDAYKNLKNGDYLLLDGGFSSDVIFPNYRIGAEYFNPFKETWEHSFGVRLFDFEGTGKIVVLNKSLSKYYGKHLSTVRVNGALSLDGGDFTNYGVAFQQRYYRYDDAYIALFASYGFDTSLIIVSDNATFNSNNPYLISAGVNYETRLLKRHKWSFTYAWTHYDFGIGTRDQHTFSVFYLIKRKGHESH